MASRQSNAIIIQAFDLILGKWRCGEIANELFSPLTIVCFDASTHVNIEPARSLVLVGVSQPTRGFASARNKPIVVVLRLDLAGIGSGLRDRTPESAGLRRYFEGLTFVDKLSLPMKESGTDQVLERLLLDASAFPLVDFALTLLRRGADEPFVFLPGASEVLMHALHALLLTDVDHEEPIFSLVLLSCALDEKESSPSASEVIKEALRSSPQAIDVIERWRVQDAARKQAFANFNGQRRGLAPRFGEPTPEGTVRARQFIDPGTERHGPAGRSILHDGKKGPR